MLGLDIASLAVPDYEIIARVERLIATVNGTLMHASTAIPVPAVPAYTTIGSRDYVYSSSSSIIGDTNHSTSPSRRHHRRERSPSPQKRQHSSNSYHHHHHITASPTRNRSKSPRKVTIDPNSY